MNKELQKAIFGNADGLEYYAQSFGPPFLTGSFVYGEFGPDSDLDMVVAMDPDMASRLIKLQEDSHGIIYPYLNALYPGSMGYSLRFGCLNVLAVFTVAAYEAWAEGTAELLGRKIRLGRPMTRQEVIEVFDRVRKERGVI